MENQADVKPKQGHQPLAQADAIRPEVKVEGVLTPQGWVHTEVKPAFNPYADAGVPRTT